jgi:hypothetical protein
MLTVLLVGPPLLFGLIILAGGLLALTAALLPSRPPSGQLVRRSRLAAPPSASLLESPPCPPLAEDRHRQLAERKESHPCILGS